MLSRLHNRIFLMYSLLFLFIFVIVLTILSFYISNTTNRQITASLIAYSENVSAQIEDKFRQMDRISTRLLFSQAIMDTMNGILTNYNGQYNYFDLDRSKLNVIFQSFLVILGLDISNTIINIYNEKSFITTAQSSTNWNNIKKDAQEGVLAEIMTALRYRPNSPLLLGPHKAFWVTESDSLSEYFSLSRKLYDLTTGRDMGILQVLKSRAEIENLCNNNNETIQIFLFDKENKILNDSLKINFMSDAKLILEGNKAILENRIIKGESGENYLLSTKKINGSDYSILIMQQYNSGFIWVYVGSLLAMLVFLMIVAVSINYFISRYLTRPLDQIIWALRQITWNNFEMNIDFHSSTEDLKQLQQFYNQMLSRVREAMNQILQSKLNEREAYYLALQSQISPHFIYNCISNINAIAYENNVHQINDICELLSNMLRYVTKFDTENSTIKQEVEYTCNYLKLMRIRYADEFVFSVHMDEICGNFSIPKLMLQTIVENCFKHAFPKTPFPWSININIYCENNTWIAEVIDNGIGIENDKIDKIITQSQNLYYNALQGIEELKLGGLGLLNSLTRFRLLYNNKIFFSAESMCQGTIIRFGGEFGNEQIQSNSSGR